MRAGAGERAFLATPHLIRSARGLDGLLLLLADVEALEQVREGAQCHVALDHVRLAAELMAHRVRNPLNAIVLVLELLARRRQTKVPTEVIIITGQGSVDTALQAMRDGAYDYLTKPVDVPRLLSILPKAVERYEILRTNQELKRRIEKMSRFEDLIGESAEMREVYRLIEAVADTDATVFIQGESGTGKELLARALHNRSSRAAREFVPINCGALPRDIIENELFGHVKGAFTGSVAEKVGSLERGQAVPPPGRAGHDPARRALHLSVVEIHLPPLRSRLGDILLLAEEFLKTFGEKYEKRIRGFDPKVTKALQEYSWPGNVRELKNVTSSTATRRKATPASEGR